jgi:osmotically-inducible protein OsmY
MLFSSIPTAALASTRWSVRSTSYSQRTPASVVPTRDKPLSANERVAERIRQGLDETGHRELRQVHVTADGHWIELDGSVSSYYHKQLAQEVARQAAPGRQIYNEVRVHGRADRRRPR